jgi:hypothetical protein
MLQHRELLLHRAFLRVEKVHLLSKRLAGKALLPGRSQPLQHVHCLQLRASQASRVSLYSRSFPASSGEGHDSAENPLSMVCQKPEINK